MTIYANGKLTTRLIRIDPRRIKLLEKNARYLRHEMYHTLVENIRRDGALSSVPFLCLNEGHSPVEPDDVQDKWLCLSGNHRVKASIDAELEEIDAMVTEEPLDEARKIAIQLSHNAIAGEDDPATLRELYEQIEEVDWRVYAGLDDKILELMADVKIGSLSEVNLSFQVLTITFLPDEVERVKATFDEARKMTRSDHYYLARFGEYDRFMDALEEAGNSYNVKNVATEMMLVLDLFDRHRDDLRAGWLTPEGEAAHSGYVPLSTVFGTPHIPAKAAAVIARAIQKMKDNGDLGEGLPWRAAELWAADYWAGEGFGI